MYSLSCQERMKLAHKEKVDLVDFLEHSVIKTFVRIEIQT